MPVATRQPRNIHAAAAASPQPVSCGIFTRQPRRCHDHVVPRYGVLEDVQDTTTWQQIQALGEAGNETGWIYNYSDYMRRPEWQLYDVRADPLCLENLVEDEAHAATLNEMRRALAAWQRNTSDPWAPCNPALPGSGTDWLATHSEICSF